MRDIPQGKTPDTIAVVESSDIADALNRWVKGEEGRVSTHDKAEVEYNQESLAEIIL